jgi:hypothetical protein
MYSLSRWASHNRKLSILLIFLCWIPLNILAIETAWWMIAADMAMPAWVLPLGLVLGIGGLILYPNTYQRKQGWGKLPGYHWHKACDGALVLATVLLLTGLIHQHSEPLVATNSENPTAVFTVLDFEPVTATSKFDRWKQKWGQRLAPIKEKVQQHAQHRIAQFEKLQKTLPIWAQILISLGALAAGVGLWILVAAWSCNLTCSGNETAGMVVFIVGTLAIIGALVWAGFKIWKKKPSQPAADS